jgi:Ca-activated chloride channel family protein
MNFLNLSLGELVGLSSVIVTGVVALYLLDRSKRRQVVSTLRFWAAADVRTDLKHRKRIQQPLSLFLQVLSILLLLLALAGPRLGGLTNSARDHVVILDTSAWMGMRAGQGTLMDQARASARSYIASLPGRDRVMLVRADALATPATPFEENRQVLNDAIRQSRPGASVLNLQQALDFAVRSQKLQSSRPGEIVFAGAGRVSEDEAALNTVPANLRVLPVAATQENVGLRKIGLRRAATPDVWEIFVVVRNYGVRPHDVNLALQFGGAPVGARRISLKPGTEEQESFTYRTRVAGLLETRVDTRDAFPQDDRAVIELPAQQALRVAVYSPQPELLRALIASNPQVNASFELPAKYDPQTKADVVVLDRFAPEVRPKADSIWIEPPSARSPVPVKFTRSSVKLESWGSDTTLGAGLRTKDVRLESAEIFTAKPGDISVAEGEEGPLVVARQDAAKTVVIGFSPTRPSMRYELATPLLVANILRWMAPETFLRWEVQAGTVGTVNVPLEKSDDLSSIRVLGENQRALPFTTEAAATGPGVLRFFSGAPGTVRVLMKDRELVYSLTLPDVAEAVWRVPATVRRGIPRISAQTVASTELWPWLAVLGGLGLLLDWLLFGRSRAFRLRPGNIVTRMPWAISRWGTKTPVRKAS